VDIACCFNLYRPKIDRFWTYRIRRFPSNMASNPS
jgi:hypothetical protein